MRSDSAEILLSSEARRLRSMDQPAKDARLIAARGLRVQLGDAPARLTAKHCVHRATQNRCARQPRNQDFPEF
jgi:hypothetical protein